MNFDSIVIIRKLDRGDQHLLTDSVVELIRSKVKELGVDVFVDDFDYDDITQRTLFIAVGGDGTMLHTIKLAAAIKAHVIGINTGRLGFLTDFPADTSYWSSFISSLVRGSLEVDERLLLNASLDNYMHSGFVATSVNEFSIAHLESDTIVDFELRVDDKFAGNHRSTSVIISTPTGSTAYSLSAGGSILHPSMDAIEIVPVASLRMASRPIVVSGKSKITILVKSDQRNGPIVVRSDGQKVLTWNNMHEDMKLDIQCTTDRAKLLHIEGWNFFDVLSRKMGWLA